MTREERLEEALRRISRESPLVYQNSRGIAELKRIADRALQEPSLDVGTADRRLDP